MKLLKARVHNFGCYDQLEFAFNDAGLSLVQGPTGAGKSTLLDISVWILFGETAKRGNADEVRSWSKLEGGTTGQIEVELNSGTITVVRKRGKQGKNDLYFYSSEDYPIRGKDITDTQKLLNDALGIDCDTYFSSSYFCESSLVSSFFSSKVKDQKEVFEKIANLDFANKLSESVKEHIKIAKDKSQQTQAQYGAIQGTIDGLNKSIESQSIRGLKWDELRSKELSNLEKSREESLAKIKISVERWESDRASKINVVQSNIDELLSIIKDKSHFDNRAECPTCGSINKDLIKEQRDNDLRIQGLIHYKERLKTLVESVNPNIAILEREQSSDYSKLIEAKSKEINPFVESTQDIRLDIEFNQAHLNDLSSSLEVLKSRLSTLNHLSQLSILLSGEILRKVIVQIQNKTNEYLEKHFESELRTSFSIDEAGKLDALIQKNGNICVYRQLSKGQRQLLKLCFGVAVIEASSNRSGVHIDNLFFDEALDGLDQELKVKSFNLFSNLSTKYGSIFVVEHSSELKELFDTKFTVVTTGNSSNIAEG